MAKLRWTEPPQLVADLRTLCLTSVAKDWRRLVEESKAKRQALPAFLADVASFEVCQRRERRIQRRLHEAKFPVLKTLDSFDFKAQPALDKDAVLELFACDFAAAAHNVVLVGGVGTGKTHLAIALGMACVQQDLRVRFVTAAELCNLLIEAQANHRLTRALDRLARFDVVVLDSCAAPRYVQ